MGKAGFISSTVALNSSKTHVPGPQRLQYPLVKEYTLNYSRDLYYNLRYSP